MIIIELQKDEILYAEKIANLSEMSSIVVEPKSFSSELNDIIQVAVQLSSYIIPAISLIIIELIKKAKKVKIKISKTDLEAEGISEETALKLIENHIKKSEDEKALEALQNLLKLGLDNDDDE